MELGWPSCEQSCGVTERFNSKPKPRAATAPGLDARICSIETEFTTSQYWRLEW